MGRKKKEDQIKQPYKINPPCLFECEVIKFDIEKMGAYEWREFGRYWRGNKEYLVLEVIS